MSQNSELLNSINKIQTIVDIDSQTLNVDGVKKVQTFVKSSLVKLGFSITEHNISERAPLLIGKRKGNIDLTISLISHADTALRPTNATTFKIDKEKMLLLGNGVADNKAGIVLGLEAISALIKENQNIPNIFFICSPNEEEGSLGCHEIFRKLGQESQFVLGLEPALSNGNIITSRNGNRWYTITAKGKMAHSGRMESPNLNPAHDLFTLSNQIINTGDIYQKTKVNITSIRSSTHSANTIPEFCEMKVDVRFPSIDFRDKIEQKINHYIYNTPHSCVIANAEIIRAIQIDDDCPPMALKSNHTIFTNVYLRNLIGLENTEYDTDHSGGAADINYFSTNQNITIDGLGPRGRFMHSSNENTTISDVLTRRIALTNTLRFLCQQYTHLQGEEHGNDELF